MDLEIAVVGGGVSGAYSAWRLQQAKTEAHIGLFEYSDRIGGRLYTATLPGLPHVKAELGGMRYIPGQHILVKCLVDHLKLAKKEFPMGAPAPVGSKCNLFYLRGRHLRLHELADPAKVPYNLAWSERGLGPTNLQVQVMNNIYPNMANLSLCDQMKLKVFGKSLWKHGFWDLMYRVLSNEGYQFMKDAGGYDANVANANAVTQLPATEYSDSTKFLTLRDGCDQLPITLAREFNETFEGATPKGHRVHMNRRLAEITIGSGDYPYTLIFEPTVTNEGKTTLRLDADILRVRAKKVILALPRRSLELIKSDVLRRPVAEGQHSLGPHPVRFQTFPGLRAALVASVGIGGGTFRDRLTRPADLLLRYRRRAEAGVALHEFAADGQLQRHWRGTILEGFGKWRTLSRAIVRVAWSRAWRRSCR